MRKYKRLYSCMLLLIIIGLITGCTKKIADSPPEQTELVTHIKQPSVKSMETLKITDYLETQLSADKGLQDAAEKKYSIEDPFVVVNPYGNSPLTAIVVFTTSVNTEVDMVVKGKDEKDNITNRFPKAKKHVLPVYGLYIDDATEVVFTLEDGTQKSLMIITEKIDAALVQAEVTTIDETVYSYSNLNFVSVNWADSGGYGAAAYDSKGNIRWLLEVEEGRSFPLKRVSNGNIIISSQRVIEPYYHSTGLIEMDLCGKIFKDYLIPGGQHHDFVELENGNLLVAGNRPDFSTVEDYVVEIDRNTGEIVYELDLMEIMDPSDGGSINRTDKDWFHNNTIDYDKDTDTIILSGRHVDAVVGVNKAEKKVSWILGDPNGWENTNKDLFFTPVSDNNAFEWPYAQHEATLTPDGKILLFDNGAGRIKAGEEDKKVTGDNVYSRAVLYHIDTNDMSIEQNWEYGRERGPSWYSENISGVQYLGENDYLVTSGAVRYLENENTYDVSYTYMGSDLIRTSYIDRVKDDKLVFELKLSSHSYRCYQMPLYPPNYVFSLQEIGRYLGNLGRTQTVSNLDSLLEDIKKPEFTFTVEQFKERVLVSGNWKETSEDAVLILRDSSGNDLVYKIKQPIYKIENAETVDFSVWVSPVGLEDCKFDIYIMNAGNIYSTGYRVQF